jgi:hypothetical protein
MHLHMHNMSQVNYTSKTNFFCLGRFIDGFISLSFFYVKDLIESKAVGKRLRLACETSKRSRFFFFQKI